MPTHTFQTGLGDSDLESTYIIDALPTTNFNASAPRLGRNAGKVALIYRCLLQLDLSSFDANTVFSSAPLDAKITTVASSAGDKADVRLCNVDVVMGQVTWNERSSGNAWTNAGLDDSDDTLNDVDILQSKGSGLDTIGDLATALNYALANASDLSAVTFLLVYQDESSGGNWMEFRDDTWVTTTERPKITAEYTVGGTYSKWHRRYKHGRRTHRMAPLRNP